MGKTVSFARAFKKADAQRQEQQRQEIFGPGLALAEAEGTVEHMERRAGYQPERKKNEKSRSEREKGSRGGHLSAKGILNAEAIGHVAEHVGHGKAKHMVDPKRGSRCRQRLVAK